MCERIMNWQTSASIRSCDILVVGGRRGGPHRGHRGRRANPDAKII
jgi:hypothetical protein